MVRGFSHWGLLSQQGLKPVLSSDPTARLKPCPDTKLKRVHIILETSEPTHHRIAIPDHHPPRLGAFHSILRAVAGHKGVRREAIIADL